MKIAVIIVIVGFAVNVVIIVAPIVVVVVIVVVLVDVFSLPRILSNFAHGPLTNITQRANCASLEYIQHIKRTSKGGSCRSEEIIQSC